ncbi:hypothetical protein BDW22DRAFT_1363776 [Trametopsis cervina]|nr:hypothetical protein BDW22DRAFT_1363776 [Trametopsis cervina]
MTPVVHDITTESTAYVVSPDSEASLSSSSAHAHPLDTTPTDLHSSEEPRAVGTHADDHNRGEDNAITQSEGLPTSADLTVNVASVQSPLEAVDGRAEERSSLVPDATMSNAPSSQISFVTPVASSQDIQPDHGDGVTTSGSPRRSGTAYGLGTDTENTRADAYSTSIITLPSSSYDSPDKDGGKESTNAAVPSASDTAEATDTGGTSERAFSTRDSGPVHGVEVGHDDEDRSRDGDGSVSTREGTEDRGGGD